MERSDWGVKRICNACSTVFYDFKRDPIVCPSCGELFSPSYMIKKKPKQPSVKKVIDAEEVEIDIDLESDDSEVLDEVEIASETE